MQLSKPGHMSRQMDICPDNSRNLSIQTLKMSRHIAETCPDKLVILSGQVHAVVWTNMVTCLDKYGDMSGQVAQLVWTNCPLTETNTTFELLHRVATPPIVCEWATEWHLDSWTSNSLKIIHNSAEQRLTTAPRSHT